MSEELDIEIKEAYMLEDKLNALTRQRDDLLDIATDLLTWCIEPDKKLIYSEKIEAIQKIKGE